MGALALTGQQPKRTPFEPMTPGVEHVPYGDVGRARRRRRRRHRRGVPGADPGRGRRGHPAGRLPAGGPARSPPSAARCWCSTRCRPASAAPAPGSRSSRPASCPTWSRWPRASAAGCRSARASASAPRATCSQPGQHGTTFGGNPVCCAAALAVLRTIAEDGLLEHVTQVGKEIATGVEALGHPLVARGQRGRPAARHRLCASRCPPRSRRPPARAGSWSTTRCPTGSGWSRRWCSPRPRPREFLAALPDVPGRRQMTQ